jgi:hypothetical protein
MIANVDISFKFLGGSTLLGPINKLQNALSFNYFANSQVYDPRANYLSKEKPIINVKVKNSDGTESDASKVISDSLTGYYLHDMNDKGIRIVDGETTITEELFKLGKPPIAQEDLNELELFSEDPETPEPTPTVSITAMFCDDTKITKTDSEWYLPVKFNYSPTDITFEEAASALIQDGYNKIRIKDVNGKEMYEDSLSVSNLSNFLDFSDYSDEAKFRVPNKGANLGGPGIKDSSGKEKFYISIIKNDTEEFKLNIKLP